MSLAVFCDQAIEDKSGVLTIIRIVDQVTLMAAGPDAPEELPPGAAINTTLVIGLKAGQARGRQALQVTFVHPDGSRHPGPELNFHLAGLEHSGQNFILKAGVALSDAGIYWAEVWINKRLVTRTPLDVRYEISPPGIQPAP